MKTQDPEGDFRPNPSRMSDSALDALLHDIFAQDALGFGNDHDEAPAFDPIAIRDLLRDAAADGKHPAKLVLGHQQADSYRDLLLAEYGELPPKGLKDSYYLGLQIVEEDTPDKLALAGEKPHDAWEGQLPPPWRDDHTPGAAHQAA